MENFPTPSASEKFPDELRQSEQATILARRALNGGDPAAPQVGFALSGGGIRSATFCLGFFQALAKQKLIRKIDYLSTVSGGGYFGGFLGTAFTRDDSDADKVERELADNHSWPVNWLRENGRFLSPNGSGDNWMTAAVALRNWVALHLVLLTFSFFFIGLGALVRVDLVTWSVTRRAWRSVEVFFWNHQIVLNPDPGNFNVGSTFVWLSPWLILPVIPFVLVMLPTGFFYWATQLTPVVAVLRGIGGLFSKSTKVMTNAEFASRAQLSLTRGLMVGMIATVLLFIYAVMDTLGQTAYAPWAEGGFHFPALWTALTASGAGAYAFAAKITVYIEQFLGTKKFRISTNIIALGLALIWVSLFLFSLSVIAAGFAWKWEPVTTYNSNDLLVMPGGFYLLVAVSVCFALSWFFSRAFSFVNLSSMQQMYAARLSRAYLGATNPLRRENANHSMTDLLPGDEVPLDEYAPHLHGGPLHLVNVTINETVSGKTQIERRDRKGLAMAVGPCGMSVGLDSHALWAPSETGAEKSLLKALWEERKRTILPILASSPAPHALSTAPFPGVKAAEPETRQIEALSLGRWVAISGAAFTTGTGANTNLGLSLLLGLANIRLGYWWNSGINPNKRPQLMAPNFMEIGSRLISRVMPVQTCLVGEFFARFHGPARKHWYLSDGGHFENTACYELIRRRVPLIICTDAGADAKYQFEDLANLVRKARTDFGAEIQIVRHKGDIMTDDPGVEFPMPTLEEIIHPDLLDVIGTPEDFVPLSDDPDDATNAGPDGPPRAKRHALLARVHYLDDDTFSWLLLAKPSLMGDESMDVIQYQRTHPLFPQEPTSDQYFDEAQWESYRKLGEHIGNELFTPPSKPGLGWSPASLLPVTK
jgi:hypothetical protein